jgi:hypothetical protein
MDSPTLLAVCLSSALGGAIVAAAGVFVGYQLGRKAAITHEGIRQAGEVRARIVSAALPDHCVIQNRLADGAVTQYVLADRSVKPD